MKFSAEISQLHEMLQWMKKELSKGGLDAKTMQRIELAAEEIFVNIVHHGYLDKGGEVEMNISVSSNKRVEIHFFDSAVEFNPLNAKEKKVSSNLLDCEMGGLGISFVRKCVSDILYERINGKNHLTLIIHPER